MGFINNLQNKIQQWTELSATLFRVSKGPSAGSAIGQIADQLILISRRIRLFRWIFLGIASLIVFLFIYTAVVAIIYLNDRSEIATTIQNYREYLYGHSGFEPRAPIRILDRNGVIIGEMLPERDNRVTLQSCQNMAWLKRAAVSSEDRNFYEHHGVSLRGVFRAFVNNLLSLSIREGAGSITMQLARNVLTDRSHSLYRKIYETFSAFQIESLLSKDEILCMYLNRVYMGEGRIGAIEASYYYFRKPPEQLTAPEAAMIVGLFPSPVRYSPQNDILESLKKQSMVMDTLVRDGFLTDKKKDALLKQFIKNYRVSSDPEKPDSGTIGAYGASRDFRLYHPAPAANEAVKEFLFANFNEDDIRKGGWTVYTTIDAAREAAALDGIHSSVEGVRNQMREKAKGVDSTTLTHYVERLNGVMVVLEPSSGDILAIVGGYAVADGGSMTYRIWKMVRQPGSAIKGFLYGLAMDKEIIDINSKVVDARLEGDYSPNNWYRGYKGEMPLKDAVALSVNTVAVKTLADLGVDNFRLALGQALELGYFESFSRFPDSVTLALGSAEMTPMELARTYALLLNDGYVVRPRLILRVDDADGNPIWDGSSTVKSTRQVMSAGSAARAVFLLRSVIDEKEGTASWIGNQIRKNPNYLPFPVAGKSGTVQTVDQVRKKFPGMSGAHDAWFVGLAPGEVGVVWIGNDEGVPFPGSGSGSAGSAWATYASRALPGKIHGLFPGQNEIEEKYSGAAIQGEEGEPVSASENPQDGEAVLSAEPAGQHAEQPESETAQTTFTPVYPEDKPSQ